jgi:hypothetical protein
MTYGRLPATDTQEYLWWQAGTLDEAKARDEGMSSDARQLRDLLESLARSHPDRTIEDLALDLARIACPDKLRRRYR